MPILPKALFATFDVVPSPTRASAISQTLLQALARHFQVDALTLKSRELSHLEKTERVRILRIAPGKGDHIAQLEAFRRALVRQLESEEYQLVHVRSPFLGAAIAKRKAEFGVKLLVEASRFETVELPILYPALAGQRAALESLQAEERLGLLAADAVVTPSRTTREFIAERGRRDGVHFIPDGVNIDIFDWQAVRPSSPPVILYVGSLTPWQGLVTLIEAVEILCRTKPVRLVLFHPGGDEHWQTPLRNLTKNLGLQDKVEFRQALPPELLPEVLCQADLCVAPYAKVSRNTAQGGFPMKIAEYMACRRPIVASRIPMVEEVLTDGAEGLLFTPGDASDLSQKLASLLGDRTLATRLGEAAYRKARDIFSASRCRRRYSDLYRSLWEASREEFPRSGLELPIEREADSGDGLLPESSAKKSPTNKTTRPAALQGGPRAGRDEEERTTVFTMPLPEAEPAEKNPFADADPQPFFSLAEPPAPHPKAVGQRLSPPKDPNKNG